MLLVLLGLAVILGTALVTITITAARRHPKSPTGRDDLAIRIIEQRRSSDYVTESPASQRI